MPLKTSKKISSVKIRFWYVKKSKNRIRENEKVAVEILEKSLKVPTFLNLCQFFFVSSDFYSIDLKFCACKLKRFTWKKKCAWKLRANTWHVLEKSTWKVRTLREISEKSLREKRLPYVKKSKKRPKNRFTHTFFFT